MTKTYTITARQNPNSFQDQFNVNGKRSYAFDFSPWVEDNNTVTSVTWSVKTGSAVITNKALSSDKATAQIEATTEGRSIIEILADTGAEKYSAYLDLYARDPNKGYFRDYC